MIKKFYIVLFGLGLFFGLNILNAEWLLPGQYSDMAGGNNSCTIGSNLGISCTSSFHVLANTFSPGIGTALSSIFWSSDGIGIHYAHAPEGYQDRSVDFLLTSNFHVCSGDVSIGAISGFSQGLNPNCISNGYDVVGNYTYNELITKLKSETLQYRGNFTSTNAGVQLQLVFETFYFSVWVNGYGNRYSDLFNGTGNSTHFGFGNSSDYSSISWNNQNVLQHPGRSSFPDMGYGGIELGSEFSALNYYEKTYGWDESICYAGVDSLSYLYGQNGVSFNKGSGLSIFDVFEQLYGNRDLKKVYVWLNVQLFNYENWFNIPGNNIGGIGHPSWLGNYNSGTNQIDIYYDNLTFPFLNKPVAFYFIADNVEDQSPYYTMGSSVVSYCNIKINSGTFDEIIDDADKNNINNYTEQNNIHHGLNSDGTVIKHDGYFGSGVDIAFSGNTSIKNTLKNFFEEFDKAFSFVDINTSNRILPTWIVSAFIFVVLFKFLRKR